MKTETPHTLRRGSLSRLSLMIKSTKERRARHNLARQLDDHLLRDIGLTRDFAWEPSVHHKWVVPLHWRT